MFRGKRNNTTDNRRYSIPVRKFALTLFYHSPRAYKYVREKFANTLPCPRTLTKWYAQSDCNEENGILSDALKTLQSAAAELKKDGKTLLGSLAFDETFIRRHIQYDHQKKQWLGYSQYGKIGKDGSVPIANNILVFMVTALNHRISIPVAYIPIVSLDAIDKRDLLRDILTTLHNVGVKIINITFDGLLANRKACEILGASFEPTNIVPFFPHPVDGCNVYIMLDACHMLKLIRNALGDLKCINDRSRGPIEWKYFEQLEIYRVKSNFVTHRLNKRHLQYDRNRMNVRLAVETFSNSVACSMRHLLDSGVEDFKNSSSTIYLIEKMNTVFDTMNTKEIRNNASIFKSSLNPNNADAVFALYDETSNYLKTLKFKQKLCINSRRKTGFIGLLMNMLSIRHLYQEYVHNFWPTIIAGHILLIARFTGKFFQPN